MTEVHQTNFPESGLEGKQEEDEGECGNRVQKLLRKNSDCSCAIVAQNTDQVWFWPFASLEWWWMSESPFLSSDRNEVVNRWGLNEVTFSSQQRGSLFSGSCRYSEATFTTPPSSGWKRETKRALVWERRTESSKYDPCRRRRKTCVERYQWEPLSQGREIKQQKDERRGGEYLKKTDRCSGEAKQTIQ